MTFARIWAVVVALLISISAAHAELRVCNTTPSRVGLAIGYQHQKGWTTEGWWNIAAQTCESLLKAPIRSRFIYFYAIDYERGGQWTGSHAMCITSKSFMIRNIKDCEDRGHSKANFYEVDTGNATNWTIRLTDPDKTTDKDK